MLATSWTAARKFRAVFSGGDRAKLLDLGKELLDQNDVERGVVYMASLSLEANVQFMTVMATKMPYIGRG